MDIEDQIEDALRALRREMALEGGSVRLVRMDGEIAFLELIGPRSLSWTCGVTAAVQNRLPQVTVMISLWPAAPETVAGPHP